MSAILQIQKRRFENHLIRRHRKETKELKKLLSFLEMNGIRIRCTDEELVHIGLSVADGSMDYPELLEWVMEHKE